MKHDFDLLLKDFQQIDNECKLFLENVCVIPSDNLKMFVINLNALIKYYESHQENLGKIKNIYNFHEVNLQTTLWKNVSKVQEIVLNCPKCESKSKYKFPYTVIELNHDILNNMTNYSNKALDLVHENFYRNSLMIEILYSITFEHLRNIFDDYTLRHLNGMQSITILVQILQKKQSDDFIKNILLKFCRFSMISLVKAFPTTTTCLFIFYNILSSGPEIIESLIDLIPFDVNDVKVFNHDDVDQILNLLMFMFENCKTDVYIDDYIDLDHNLNCLDEKIIIEILNRLPLKKFFSAIIGLDEDDETVLFSNLGDFNKISKMFMILKNCTNCLLTGIRKFTYLENVNQNLGSLLLNVLLYANDIITICFNEYYDVFIQIRDEYEDLFIQHIKILREFMEFKLYKFFGSYNYNILKCETLWKCLSLLLYDPKKSNKSIKDINDVVYDKEEYSLIDWPMNEIDYLFRAIIQISLTCEIYDNFIIALALVLFNFGFYHDVSRINNAIKAISEMTERCLIIVPYFLDKFNNDTFIVEKEHLQFFKALKLQNWIPDERSLNIIWTWVLYENFNSNRCLLARMILGHLNWGFDSNNKLFLNRDIHIRIALLILKVMSLEQVLNNNKIDKSFETWCWKMVIMLKLHCTETVINNDISLQNSMACSSPVLESVTELTKEISYNNPLAYFIAIKMCDIGHLVPLILENGLHFINILLNNEKFEAVIHSLKCIMPKFNDNFELLLDNDKVQNIINQLFHTHSIHNDLINLIVNQIQSYNKCDAAKGYCSFWIKSTLRIEKWFENRITLEAINIILKNTFFDKATNAIIYHDLELKIKDLCQNNEQTANKNYYFGVIDSLSNLFLSIYKSSDYVRLLSFDLKNISKQPFNAYMFILIESNIMNSKCNLLRKILEKMVLMKNDIQVDNILKIVESDLGLKNISLNDLYIIKWLNLILLLPKNCAILPLFYHQFFNLYLTQIPLENGKLSEYLAVHLIPKALKINLLSKTEDIITNLIEINNNSQLLQFYSICKYILTTDISSLDPSKLMNITSIHPNLWLNMQNILYDGNNMKEVISKHNSNESIVEILKNKVQRRLKLYREITSFPLFKYDNNDQKLINNLSTPNVILNQINNQFQQSLVNIDQYFKCKSTHLKRIDNTLFDLIEKLYTNVTKNVTDVISCKTFLCSHKFNVKYSIQNVVMNENIKKQIDDNQLKLSKFLCDKNILDLDFEHHCTLSLVNCILNNADKYDKNCVVFHLEFYLYMCDLLDSTEFSKFSELLEVMLREYGEKIIKKDSKLSESLLKEILKRYDKSYAYLLVEHFQPPYDNLETFSSIMKDCLELSIYSFPLFEKLVGKIDLEYFLNNFWTTNCQNQRNLELSYDLKLIATICNSFEYQFDNINDRIFFENALTFFLMPFFKYNYPLYQEDIFKFLFIRSNMDNIPEQLLKSIIGFLIDQNISTYDDVSNNNVIVTQLTYNHLASIQFFFVKVFQNARFESKQIGIFYGLKNTTRPIMILIKLFFQKYVEVDKVVNCSLTKDSFLYKWLQLIQDLFKPFITNLGNIETIPWDNKSCIFARIVLNTFFDCVSYVALQYNDYHMSLDFIWKYYSENFIINVCPNWVYEDINSCNLIKRFPWKEYNLYSDILEPIKNTSVIEKRQSKQLYDEMMKFPIELLLESKINEDNDVYINIAFILVNLMMHPYLEKEIEKCDNLLKKIGDLKIDPNNFTLILHNFASICDHKTILFPNSVHSITFKLFKFLELISKSDETCLCQIEFSNTYWNIIKQNIGHNNSNINNAVKYILSYLHESVVLQLHVIEEENSFGLIFSNLYHFNDLENALNYGDIITNWINDLKFNEQTIQFFKHFLKNTNKAVQSFQLKIIIFEESFKKLFLSPVKWKSYMDCFFSTENVTNLIIALINNEKYLVLCYALYYFKEKNELPITNVLLNIIGNMNISTNVESSIILLLQVLVYVIYPIDEHFIRYLTTLYTFKDKKSWHKNLLNAVGISNQPFSNEYYHILKMFAIFIQIKMPQLRIPLELFGFKPPFDDFQASVELQKLFNGAKNHDASIKTSIQCALNDFELKKEINLLDFIINHIKLVYLKQSPYIIQL